MNNLKCTGLYCGSEQCLLNSVIKLTRNLPITIYEVVSLKGSSKWLVYCQLKITLAKITQRTSENPTKIRNKLQKYSEKLKCNTLSSLSACSFSSLWNAGSSSHWRVCSICYMNETTLLWWKLVNYIDNWLLVDN